jgi:hypothetical protein
MVMKLLISDRYIYDILKNQELGGDFKTNRPYFKSRKNYVGAG